MSIPPVAERIRSLPPYLFAEIDRIKMDLRSKGTDIIDLSIGDPDLPTPTPIVDRLCAAAKDAANHRYPSYSGSTRFRKAVAAWYEDRFNVSIDPEQEVLALIGSKEGIAHLPLAIVNPGDVVLIPDPGYPVYATATTFVGGKPVFMPLTSEHHFQPIFSEIPKSAVDKAKLMYLNYPNNPTSAVADLKFFEEAAQFGKKHQILIGHDAAYTEVCLGGFESPSFLNAKAGKENGIEFHSLSKTFNMTGWRVGFAVGNKEAIAALGKVKTNVDSGVFGAIQEAAIAALENWKVHRDANNRIYEHRTELVCDTLSELKIRFYPPKATFYIWCNVPTKEASGDFCARILREVGISLTPGIGFGKMGEGFFRISLTASEVRLQEALTRMKKYLGK